jgi:hypothetical protein
MCLLAFSANAQDRYTLVLMNGQEIPVHQLNDSSFTKLHFSFDKNQFKRDRLHLRERRKAHDYFNPSILSEKALALPVVVREGSRDRESVFAVIQPDGGEKLIYYYDEEVGNYLPVDGMRAFLAGQADAYASMRGRAWLFTGLGLGAVAGYAARGSVLALVVPPVFALSTKIPTVRIPAHKISDMRYQHDPDYAAGFETQARSKHLREALKGSAIGTALGLIAYAIIDNNR